MTDAEIYEQRALVHAEKAKRALDLVGSMRGQDRADGIATAQVHATLAAANATLVVATSGRAGP